ncbi:response regulator [bacterium]|nr:response regulator [bacterium]
MRILIIDDEPDICELVECFLRPYGECEKALSGAEAIEIIKRYWSAEEDVDCVFLDLMMPGMDGIETLKTIRQMEHPRVCRGIKEIKIIMLTASNNPKYAMRVFEGQIAGYVRKPFDEKKLVDALEKSGLLSS